MIAFFFLLVAGLLAHAPLLVEFFRHLWLSSNHFFFPLGLLIAVGLIVSRRYELFVVKRDKPEASSRLTRSRGTTIGIASGLGVTGLLVACAYLLHWPHLGWVSFLVLLWTLAYAEFGGKGASSIVPVLVLLFFLKPIPEMFEPWTQLGLQGMVSGLAGVFLDLLGVFHYSEGVVLGLVSQDTLAEGLCSGVRSLYWVVFLAIAWGIHYRYHWLRTTLNVCQAIFWVILGNAVRVAALLWNQDRGGTWLESPTAVSSSEYLVLLAVLFFLWSGDQLFSSVFERKDADTDTDEEPADRAGVDFALSTEPKAWVWGFGIVFLAIGLASWRWMGLHAASSDPLPIANRIAATLGEGDWNGWKVTPLESQSRLIFDGSKLESQRWSLEQPGKSLFLDVEQPWRSQVPAQWSLQWRGWRVQKVPASKSSESAVASDGVSMFRCTRLPGESDTVAVSSFDGQQHSLDGFADGGPLSHVGNRMLATLRYLSGGEASDQAVGLIPREPWTVAKLHWNSAKPLDSEQLKELGETFELLLGTSQPPSGSETAEGDTASAENGASK